MLFILHSCCITPVTQPLLHRNAAPPPCLHIEAIGYEAGAGEGGPDVVGDVGVTGRKRVDGQLWVEPLPVVRELPPSAVVPDVFDDDAQL